MSSAHRVDVWAIGGRDAQEATVDRSSPLVPFGSFSFSLMQD